MRSPSCFSWKHACTLRYCALRVNESQSSNRSSTRIMNANPRDQRTSEHFVDPSCRPGRFDSGATLAVGLLASAIIVFQFTDESSWYAIGGGLLLAASLILGWRNRAALLSVFRHPRDADPRQLSRNRNRAGFLSSC